MGEIITPAGNRITYTITRTEPNALFPNPLAFMDLNGGSGMTWQVTTVKQIAGFIDEIDRSTKEIEDES